MGSNSSPVQTIRDFYWEHFSAHRRKLLAIETESIRRLEGGISDDRIRQLLVAQRRLSGIVYDEPGTGDAIFQRLNRYSRWRIARHAILTSKKSLVLGKATCLDNRTGSNFYLTVHLHEGMLSYLSYCPMGAKAHCDCGQIVESVELLCSASDGALVPTQNSEEVLLKMLDIPNEWRPYAAGALSVPSPFEVYSLDAISEVDIHGQAMYLLAGAWNGNTNLLLRSDMYYIYCADMEVLSEGMTLEQAISTLAKSGTENASAQ
jgi:hypothetical protein